jgi:2-dehydropantoate 2-reductase
VKFLFLGAGGIGGLVGGRLVEAGADVTFLVREKRKAQLLQHGLQIESPLGNATLQVQAKLKSEIEPIYDLVFLTCKAYDLPSAIDSIRPALSDSAAILPVLNGIAHIARLNDEFGRKNVLGGTIKMQANLTSTGVVRQLSNWQTITLGEQDGSITERVKEAADLIAKTGIEVKLSQNVMGDLWFKLIHLSTVAGMTCLMRANIGEIVRTPDGSALLRTFFQRNIDISAHAGYRPDEKFIDTYLDLFSQRDARYEASMLRDLEKGGRIESEQILGYMLEKCRGAGIPDTLHAAAYTAVKAYEERRAAGRLPGAGGAAITG